MPLTRPALADAVPGAPVTAQAWNDIVGGLLDLYDAVLALGGAVVEVEAQFEGVAIGGASVVAEPLGDGGTTTPVGAIPPIGPRTSHLIVGLTPGQWRIRVEVDGLTAESRDVTVPVEAPLVIDLEAAGPLVPDVFGLGTLEARGALNNADIPSDRLRIIDSSGQEIAAHDVSPEHANAEVLVQTPEPGSILVDGAEVVRLVVAAPLVQTETVTMPSLSGLTLAEATAALKAIGLSIGESEIRN